MTQLFCLSTEKNVCKKHLDEEMIKNDKLLQKFAIGVYKNRRYELPLDWKCILTSNSNESWGFHAEAYEKNGKIILVYRGTNDIMDIGGADRQMFLRQVPDQAKKALNFYYEVERYCKKYGIDPENITITGHSLGGSLAQIIAKITNRKAVTFNAYGIRDIAERFGLLKSYYPPKIRNYGNANDWTFASRLHLQIGDTYVIDTNKYDTELYPLKYHFIETMGDIAEAEPYDRRKHHKNISENMDSNRVLVVEEVIDRKNKKDDDVFSYYFLNQVKKGMFMWERDIEKNIRSGKVYVHEYTKQDGTYVREYYRRWPQQNI